MNYSYIISNKPIFIGFVYLPPELAKPGTKVEVEVDSFCERIPAVVGPLCNYDSKGEKIRV
jgi:glycine cleavage system aminomethyltransferase T